MMRNIEDSLQWRRNGSSGLNYMWQCCRKMYDCISQLRVKQNIYAAWRFFDLSKVLIDKSQYSNL